MIKINKMLKNTRINPVNRILGLKPIRRKIKTNKVRLNRKRLSQLKMENIDFPNNFWVATFYNINNWYWTTSERSEWEDEDFFDVKHYTKNEFINYWNKNILHELSCGTSDATLRYIDDVIFFESSDFAIFIHSNKYKAMNTAIKKGIEQYCKYNNDIELIKKFLRKGFSQHDTEKWLKYAESLIIIRKINKKR